MAVINVNHQTLKSAASVFEKYGSIQDGEMKDITSALRVMLTSGWTGADADAFGQQWDKVNTSDSTAGKFKKAVEAYGKALSASAEAYRKAQEESYNEVNRIF